MKYCIPIFSLFLIIGLSSAGKMTNHPERKKVFVCDSEGSTKYHLKKNCKGLEKCKHEVLKITKEEAIKKGKTELCGFED